VGLPSVYRAPIPGALRRRARRTQAVGIDYSGGRVWCPALAAGPVSRAHNGIVDSASPTSSHLAFRATVANCLRAAFAQAARLPLPFFLQAFRAAASFCALAGAALQPLVVTGVL
jgi:hypothetical protein